MLLSSTNTFSLVNPRLFFLGSLFLGLTTVWLPLSAAVTSYQPTQLVGHWYGERVLDNGVLRMWVTSRNTDGSYQDHFKECDNGRQILEQREFGSWELKGDVEYVTTTLLQGKRGYFKPETPTGSYTDPYQVVSLSEQELKYKNPETGVTYQSQKVYKGYLFGCMDRAI